MAAIDATVTLGELVAQRPARAALFERLGLDYCCGGAVTLAEACDGRALDPGTVGEMIEALERAPEGPAAHTEDRDWRGASLGELCDHIVAVHHDGLRRELPQIAELLESVIRVHGPVHHWLEELSPAFTDLRDELEVHIELEERVLFPACRTIDAAAIDESLLAAHEDDHRHAGAALSTLRELTGDYDLGRALCRTHRRLLESLRGLELDLHQHIHEENNILFPRVRTALAAAGDRHEGSGPVTPRSTPGRPAVPDAAATLPTCCRGWIAEETHREANVPRRPAERPGAEHPTAELAEDTRAMVEGSHPPPR